METYYSAKERRAQILQLLKSSPKILVSSLSQMFNISEVTIRKDLEELENRNLLIRVRGGAIRLPKLNIAEEQATTEKKRFHYREKRSIGRMAATLIQENETIILDSGSTTMEIAKNLHSFKQLTIITNAIDIAIELSKYKRLNIDKHLYVNDYISRIMQKEDMRKAANEKSLYYAPLAPKKDQKRIAEISYRYNYK